MRKNMRKNIKYEKKRLNMRKKSRKPVLKRLVQSFPAGEKQ